VAFRFEALAAAFNGGAVLHGSRRVQ